MEELFKELTIDVNLQELIKESFAIIEKAGWFKNQIALQYANTISWHSGVGESNNLEAEEYEFVKYHPDLDGTHIKTFFETFPIKVAHARIMKLSPKTCYSTHVDYYTRYHVPLISKPLQTFMVFPDCQNSIVRMHPGKVYWTNTHQLHNFVNGSEEDRLHIVFNDAHEQKHLNNPYLSM